MEKIILTSVCICFLASIVSLLSPAWHHCWVSNERSRAKLICTIYTILLVVFVSLGEQRLDRIVSVQRNKNPCKLCNWVRIGRGSVCTIYDFTFWRLAFLKLLSEPKKFKWEQRSHRIVTGDRADEQKPNYVIVFESEKGEGDVSAK